MLCSCVHYVCCLFFNLRAVRKLITLFNAQLYLQDNCAFAFLAGGMKLSKTKVPKLTSYVKNYNCDINSRPIFYLGPLTNLVLQTTRVGHCTFDARIGYTVNAWLNIISLSAAIVSNIYFFAKKLHKKPKNKQIIYVNLALSLMHAGFLYFLVYRYFFIAERPACMFGFVVLGFSANVFLLSMIGLSVDCCVAVFKPMQYRFTVTGRRIGIFYATGLTLLLIFTVVFPMAAYAWQFDGLLFSVCRLDVLVPIGYLIASASVSLIMFLIIMVVNIATCVKIILSLIERKAMLGDKNDLSMKKSVKKIAARLGVIVYLNFLLCFPLMLLTIGVKFTYDYDSFESIAIMGIALLGFVNNIFFLLSDKEANPCKAKKSALATVQRNI